MIDFDNPQTVHNTCVRIAAELMGYALESASNIFTNKYTTNPESSLYIVSETHGVLRDVPIPVGKNRYQREWQPFNPVADLAQAFELIESLNMSYQLSKAFIQLGHEREPSYTLTLHHATGMIIAQGATPMEAICSAILAYLGPSH